MELNGITVGVQLMENSQALMGPGTAGAAAEQKVWDAVKQKPGWSVIEGRVSVRNADGQFTSIRWCCC